jgi:hypothetical protein
MRSFPSRHGTLTQTIASCGGGFEDVIGCPPEVSASPTGSTEPVLAGSRAPCTRPDRRSPGAAAAPEGEDHIKVQASLGCNRNVMRPLVHGRLLRPIPIDCPCQSLCPGGRCRPILPSHGNHCFYAAITPLILSGARFSWDWFCAAVSAVLVLPYPALQPLHTQPLRPAQAMRAHGVPVLGETAASAPKGVSSGLPAGAAQWSLELKAAGCVGYRTWSGTNGCPVRALSNGGGIIA